MSTGVTLAGFYRVVHVELKDMLSSIEKSHYQNEIALWSLSGAGFAVNVDSKIIYIDPYLNMPEEPNKRRTPVPFPPENVSKADYVVVSHEHSDHCDPRTLKAFSRNTSAVFIGPRSAVSKALEAGFTPNRVREMAPGSVYDAGGLRFMAFEALDYYAESASIFLIQTPSGNLLHSGDSLYTPTFKAVGDKFKVDISLLDYGKQLNMEKQYYMDARAVAKAAKDLRTRILVPMHWDIFWERYEDPKQILEYLKSKAPECELVVLQQGDQLIYTG
jgi:L-ascorbate 6-phosphate lactonase